MAKLVLKHSVKAQGPLVLQVLQTVSMLPMDLCLDTNYWFLTSIKYSVQLGFLSEIYIFGIM